METSHTLSKEATKELIDFLTKSLAYADLKPKIEGYLSPESPMEMGEILVHHLRLEFLIETLLKENYTSVENFDWDRMSFNNKVRLLPTKERNYSDLIKPLLTFNTIRNKFVHNLKYILQDKDIELLKKYLISVEYFKREPIITNFELVKGFCELAEFSLLMETKLYEKEMKELIKKRKIC